MRRIATLHQHPPRPLSDVDFLQHILYNCSNYSKVATIQSAATAYYIPGRPTFSPWTIITDIPDHAEWLAVKQTILTYMYEITINMYTI